MCTAMTTMCSIYFMRDKVVDFPKSGQIYRPFVTCEECEMLQNDLDFIQSRANNWKMCFNTCS